jgi:lipase
VVLHSSDRGPGERGVVFCVHGLAQHGGIFGGLAKRLAPSGYRVIAVDLRGHGASGYEPPWNLETHVGDLLETADALGVDTATWIGHSFGGRILATLAARAPQRVERLALLDPGMALPADQALAGAERDRQDWSFATPEGAANALASSPSVVATPPETIAAYVAEDLVRGSDGRLRFRYCPSALVTAWSEMALPPPVVAQVPTLLVRPVASAAHTGPQDLRYRRELGPLLKMVAVPNGHNVLWEAPAETTQAIVDFLGADGDRREHEPVRDQPAT